MNLNDFENWLNSFLNFEKLPQKNMFWLDTMEHFAVALDNVHEAVPAFHVAGSKGKGSTSAFISSILEEAGFKTGLYTSPHILSFCERVTRNQILLAQNVYEKSASELVEIISSQAEKTYLKDRPITWFELITLYAFICFRNAGLDAAVYEVGLGGRLDATNIIKPEVSCIGPIELEHTEFLGDTVEKIAAEKGGIIKENTPVVIAAQSDSVKEVFRKIAAEKNAPLSFVDEVCEIVCSQNYTYSEELSCYTMQIQLDSPVFGRTINTALRMPGEFQAQNAALAAVVVKTAYPDISEDVIEKGLSKAFLPARFEILRNPKGYSDIPLLILDGAHTPRSVGFTLENIQKINTDDLKFNLLFACAADKDAKDIALMFKDRFNAVFLTKPGNVKQSDISGLKKAFDDSSVPYNLDEDFTAQIKKALDESVQSKACLLVTGSFYLVSEVKKYLTLQ